MLSLLIKPVCKELHAIAVLNFQILAMRFCDLGRQSAPWRSWRSMNMAIVASHRIYRNDTGD